MRSQHLSHNEKTACMSLPPPIPQKINVFQGIGVSSGKFAKIPGTAVGFGGALYSA